VSPTTCRRGAPFSPPNQLPTSNRTSNSQPNPTQPTAKPILSALWLIFLPLPEAFPITPKPFNLHNSLSTGGFLQTVVSDAPAPHDIPDLPAFFQWGASDTTLAFIGTKPTGELITSGLPGLPKNNRKSDVMTPRPFPPFGRATSTDSASA